MALPALRITLATWPVMPLTLMDKGVRAEKMEYYRQEDDK